MRGVVVLICWAPCNCTFFKAKVHMRPIQILPKFIGLGLDILYVICDDG